MNIGIDIYFKTLACKTGFLRDLSLGYHVFHLLDLLFFLIGVAVLLHLKEQLYLFLSHGLLLYRDVLESHVYLYALYYSLLPIHSYLSWLD